MVARTLNGKAKRQREQDGRLGVKNKDIPVLSREGNR